MHWSSISKIVIPKSTINLNILLKLIESLSIVVLFHGILYIFPLRKPNVLFLVFFPCTFNSGAFIRIAFEWIPPQTNIKPICDNASGGIDSLITNLYTQTVLARLSTTDVRRLWMLTANRPNIHIFFFFSNFSMNSAKSCRLCSSLVFKSSRRQFVYEVQMNHMVVEYSLLKISFRCWIISGAEYAAQIRCVCVNTSCFFSISTFNFKRSFPTLNA